jgi:hypothetical protein
MYTYTYSNVSRLEYVYSWPTYPCRWSLKNIFIIYISFISMPWTTELAPEGPFKARTWSVQQEQKGVWWRRTPWVAERETRKLVSAETKIDKVGSSKVWEWKQAATFHGPPLDGVGAYFFCSYFCTLIMALGGVLCLLTLPFWGCRYVTTLRSTYLTSLELMITTYLLRVEWSAWDWVYS